MNLTIGSPRNQNTRLHAADIPRIRTMVAGMTFSAEPPSPVPMCLAIDAEAPTDMPVPRATIIV